MLLGVVESMDGDRPRQQIVPEILLRRFKGHNPRGREFEMEIPIVAGRFHVGSYAPVEFVHQSAEDGNRLQLEL